MPFKVFPSELLFGVSVFRLSLCALQSQSSVLTDDEGKEAYTYKNGVEKTIRAVYSEKKVYRLCRTFNEMKTTYLVSDFISVFLSYLLSCYPSGRIPCWY